MTVVGVFFSGTETQEYVDDPNNIEIYDVNTIANYDSAIIPFLNRPIGAELHRIDCAKNLDFVDVPQK